MTRYILRRGGRVLATALFTVALFLGFVAPTAAGEFISWTGMFTPDGDCKVAAVDQSADILLFSGPVPAPPADTCSGIKAAIQKTADRTEDPFLCTQEPTQSHIVPPPPLGQDPLFDELFRGPPEFLPEELKGRVFRVGDPGLSHIVFYCPLVGQLESHLLYDHNT